MSRALVLVSALILAGTATGSITAASPFVSFTIDDNFPTPGGPGVFSDGAGDTAPNEYLDYRLVTDGSEVNWCVDAEPFAPGNLFVRLNRKLDGESGTLRCDNNPAPSGVNGVPRQFVLKIASATACGRLANPQTLLVVKDANGASWGTGVQTPCSLEANDNPRIRLGTLYKSKAKSTTLDFLTFRFGSTLSYEIQSDGEAPIVTAGSTKTVTYTGTYHLVEFPAGGRAKTVGDAFSMPARMVFTQH